MKSKTSRIQRKPLIGWLGVAAWVVAWDITQETTLSRDAKDHLVEFLALWGLLLVHVLIQKGELIVRTGREP